MLKDIYQKTEELTIRLAEIRSVNKAPGEESAVAEFIYDYYQGLPYFRKYPERLILQKTTDDVVSRHNTIAVVKGTKGGGSDKTVILMGHFDTVGIEDYGDYAAYAIKPTELVKILREHFVLSEEVIEDMASDKYLFGRGVLDMKSGIALQMLIMKHFSEHPEELKGNLVVLHTCDEEDSSKGILSSLDILSELRESEGFEYVTTINADYTTNRSPDDKTIMCTLGRSGSICPPVPSSVRRRMSVSHLLRSIRTFLPHSSQRMYR